jgi:DNA repair exonuclease SbcCD ATPase subunit
MPKLSKKVIVSESDDSDVDEVIVADTKKVIKKTPVKETKSKKETKVESSDDSEDFSDSEASESEEESEQEADSDSEEEEVEKKPREKKQKETFEEVTARIETRSKEIKDLYKKKTEQYKTLKATEKSISDLERKQSADYKLLEKSHNDDIKRVRSEKPKRKGNVNGGFNKEQPVPDVLRKFLGLPEDTKMARPKVMSALHNKFKELGLKDKQTTKIDKKTAKELGLDGPVDVEFGRFQAWLATFYPKDKEKVEVDV